MSKIYANHQSLSSQADEIYAGDFGRIYHTKMLAACQCPRNSIRTQSGSNRANESERASEQSNSLLGGSNAALSTTAGRTAAASSGAVRQDGHPLSTRGPHVSPTAVSCMTQVQSRTVVVARTIQSFIRDRAADDGGHLSFSPPMPAALPPMAAFHAINDHGPTGAEQSSRQKQPASEPQIRRRRLEEPAWLWLWLRSHPMQYRTRPLSPSLVHRRKRRDRNAAVEGPHRLLRRAATARPARRARRRIDRLVERTAKSRSAGRVPPSGAGTEMGGGIGGSAPETSERGGVTGSRGGSRGRGGRERER